MLLKKILLGLFIAPIVSSVSAAGIDCVGLNVDSTVKVQLYKSNGFANCFYLDKMPVNTPVNIVAFSNNSVGSKIELFDLNQGVDSMYIAEYYSDAEASNAVVTNSGNRRLSFSLTPTSHLTSDKNLSVTYMLVGGVGQVFLEFDDVKSTNSELPPKNGGCTYRNGQRECRNEQ
jgi:hypothetical protein